MARCTVLIALPSPVPETTHANAPSSAAPGVISRLGFTSVLAGMAAFLPPLGSIVLFWNIDRVGEWLRGHGTTGIGIYVLGFAVLAGLALLPTYASAALGGWAFGFANAFPAALVAFVGGSLVGYGVARPTSAERVQALLVEHPKWLAVRDALVGGSAMKTLGIVSLLRFPPNSPFAITNLMLASVRTPLWIYTLGTLIGMAPRTAVVVFVASTLREMSAKDAAKSTPWWWFAVGIGLGIVVLGVLGVIGNRAIQRATGMGRGSGEVAK